MRIRKFVEDLGYGRTTNRVGYALDPANLPEPFSGTEWREDTSFDEGEAITGDPSIFRVFDVVREKGFATVDRKL
jgi:hypothetical protein